MGGNKLKEGFASFRNAIRFYEAIGELGEAPLDVGSREGLYHYTSTKVLNAILSSGTFRASNLFYLNDEIEYKRGIDTLSLIFSENEKIKKYISEIGNFDGKSWGGVFSISYSNQPDVLQQWITYAKESGVCIELNSDIVWNQNADELYLGIKTDSNADIRLKNKCFLKLAYEASSDSPNNTLPQLDPDKIRLAFAEAILRADNPSEECVTIDETKINEIWDRYSDEAKQFLQLLASYYKEERFRGEGEIRAAFLPIYKDYGTKTKISYFEQSNGILRPYIDVRFLHKYHDKDEVYVAECPIKSILVGPSGNQKKVYDSIVHRLKYGEVKGWKYNEEQLSVIISEYILACIREGDVLIDKDYYDIVSYLVSNWCSENSYSYHIDKATEAMVKVRVFMSDSKVGVTHVNDNAKEIANKYLENNYLSSGGIWVKKSSLPYNF